MWFDRDGCAFTLELKGILSASSEWSLNGHLYPWVPDFLSERKYVACLVTMMSVSHGKEVKGLLSGLVPLFLRTVTVTEVPPGFPLQTHFCFFRYVLFLSLLVSFFLSKQTHVFVFSLFFVFGWSVLPVLCQSFICPPSPPSFLTHVWIISMKYFWVLFYFHMTVESIQLLFVYYSYSLMIS